MIKIGGAIEILNPYDWLPGYGESDVTLCSRKGDLSIIIGYDGGDGEHKKELFFKTAVAFHKSAMPGPELLNFKYSPMSSMSIGSLIQYPNSAAAVAWRQHFKGRLNIKHYSIVFLAQNISVSVFATDVMLRDPI